METVRTDPRLTGMRAVIERFVSKLPSGDGHDAWHDLLQHSTHLTERAEALYDLRTARGATEHEGAHAKRVLLAAAKYAKEAETTIERMNKTWANGMSMISARIKAKTKLNPDGFASEVRDLYRRSTPTERVKLLNELLEEGRGPEFAAIVKAPRSLTGMPEQQRQHYEDAFIARHAPDEVRARDALDEAFQTSLVIHREAQRFAAAYSDPSKLEAMIRTDERAAAAQARYDSGATS